MTKKLPAKVPTRNESDLLIEIGCEDLPARFVRPMAEALHNSVVASVDRLLGGTFKARGVAKMYATPRRIAVLVENLLLQQPDQIVDRLGPALAAAFKDGKPTPAALGFAKSCGVALSALGEKEDKLHFYSAQPGRSTVELLPEIFEDAIRQMDTLVPKRMRWGSGEETFVRPVEWLVCMLGTDVVPLSKFGLNSGNTTKGHRFHAPKALILRSPADYEEKLKSVKVFADFESRRELIRQQIETTAKKLGGHTRPNEALLEEVTALVEWPVVISGRMDERFMALPPEVIITTIEHNQRYFPVFGSGGTLLPVFVAVSNIESRDETDVVVGNERVVRPRLSDALFFWDQDRKRALDADFVEALDRVSFQQKLGSMGDKRRRIEALSRQIATKLGEDADTVERAATLCKADLVSRMVFEFPELQGIMGGYYAQSAGEPEAVAQAIREHYQPTLSGGAIPSTPIGCVIALSDKLDTLAGIFVIGQKPSANKDPYALRRAALGVLRILIEGELNLDLRELLTPAVELQPGAKNSGVLVDELLQFHWDRLRAYYLDAGIAPEIFEAVMATGVTRPLDIHRRIMALSVFVGSPAASKLAAAHKRVRNILRQASERKEVLGSEITRSLAEPTELELINVIHMLQESQPGIFGHHDVAALAESGTTTDQYLKALTALAMLQGPVDGFFNAVMVMAEDPAVRANRLALLSELDGLCRAVADISFLPG